MLSYPCKRQSFPQFSFPSLCLNRMGKYGTHCTLTGSVPGFLQLRHRLPELSSWASCVSAKRKGPIQQTGWSFRRFTVLRIPAQQTKLWADIVTARLPPQESTKTGLHAGLPHAEENRIFFVLWKCQIFWNAWLNLSYCGDLHPVVHNATNLSEPPSCSKHSQCNHTLPLLTQRSSDLKCWFASFWFAVLRLVSCPAFDKGCCGQVGGDFFGHGVPALQTVTQTWNHE